MKSKKKFCSITLASIVSVFLFLTLITAVASAGQESRLSWGIEENGRPAIYGDKIVWSNSGKINLYDVKTENYNTIIQTDFLKLNLAFYGSKIVFPLYDELSVYDIPTSTTSQITNNVSIWTDIDIYGDIIVWTSFYKTNIYMHDISTHRQTQINTSGQPSNPAIYGNKIVWQEEGRSGSFTDKNNNSFARSDIYMYDISTNKETQLTTSGKASNPDIYGDRIIWLDGRNKDNIANGYGDIYMYDLLTQTETQINTSGSALDPSIDGNRIVYNVLGWKSNIYMYDLNTNKETQITTSGSASSQAIYGNIIAYLDSRDLPEGDAFTNVYMYDLAAEQIKLQAAFTSNITSGNTPLTVLFTDNSTGETPTFWIWDFGDGVISKHAMNATHTFKSPGNYTVSLTVGNDAGNNTVVKPNYIVVTDPFISNSKFPVANFSSNVTGGYFPLVVQFYDFSQNAISREWDFNNDGRTDSTEINPIYVYTAPGTYTVYLTVTNENGISSNLISISVEDENKDKWSPIADFSTNTTSGNAPLAVQFTDLSQNEESRSWDFDNDGNADSNDVNPIYTYTTPGSYIANLTVRNANGTASKTATINVLQSN